LLETRGGGHHAVLPAAGLLVTRPVQRGHHVLAELGRLFQHGLRGVLLEIGHAGQLGHFLQASQVGHGKQHVFEGGGVTHGKAFQVQRELKWGFINSIANNASQSIEGCMFHSHSSGGRASTTPAASLKAP
jgi:hypothetical protein